MNNFQLENWLTKEKDELRKAEKAIEKGQLRALESIKRTQRDMKFTQKFMNNQDGGKVQESPNLVRTSFSADDLILKSSKSDSESQRSTDKNAAFEL